MTFGTWNAKSLCRLGSLKTREKELAKDLVREQELSLSKGGFQPPEKKKGNSLGTVETGFIWLRISTNGRLL
jgi:hypothetical protein